MDCMFQCWVTEHKRKTIELDDEPLYLKTRKCKIDLLVLQRNWQYQITIPPAIEIIEIINNISKETHTLGN